MTFRDLFIWFNFVFRKIIVLPVLLILERKKFKSNEGDVVEIIKNIVKVNGGEALSIYICGMKNYIFSGMEFLFVAKCSSKVLKKKLDETHVIGIENLTQVLEPSRPILIISMYMGDFSLGFLKLMSEIKSQRNLFVFKFNGKSTNEDLLFSLFQSTSHAIEPLRAGEEGGKKAFLELRKGNVVAMVVDAEVHVTSREMVNFFGHQCAMQSGPATLAVLTKAIIVPIINYKDSNGKAVVRVEPVIYSDKLSEGESSQQIIARLTQDIATLMEGWIRIDPKQVLRWPSIAHIMGHDGTEFEHKAELRAAKPSDIPLLTKNFCNRSKSSYLVLSSIHGFSESELKTIFGEGHNIYVTNSGKKNLVLSLHDMDIEHGQARVQLFCADELNVAPRAFLHSLMQKHRIKRITSYVFADEENEINLLKNIGFVKEAVFRQHVFIAGNYVDVIVYGLQEK